MTEVKKVNDDDFVATVCIQGLFSLFLHILPAVARRRFSSQGEVAHPRRETWAAGDLVDPRVRAAGSRASF